jgi:hypothetical protein
VYQEACVGDDRFVLSRIMLTQFLNHRQLIHLFVLYQVVICCPVPLKSIDLVVLAKV